MNKVIITLGGKLESLTISEVLSLKIKDLNELDLFEIIQAIFIDRASSSHITRLAIIRFPNMRVSDLIRETFANSDHSITMFGTEFMMFSMKDIEVGASIQKYKDIKDVLTYDLDAKTAKYIDLKSFFLNEWLAPMQNNLAPENKYAKLLYAIKTNDYSFYCLEIKQ